MNLPKVVTIGAVDYSVVADAKAVRDFNGRRAESAWAFTDKFTTAITLDGDMSDSRMRETLLHECIHALLYEHSIDYGDAPEEPLVEALGNAFLQLIRDNPSLIRCLASE